MQELNSLCTDNPALRAEYCIVGIPHNIAVYFYFMADMWTRCSKINAQETFIPAFILFYFTCANGLMPAEM